MTDPKRDLLRFLEGIAALARRDVHNTFNVSVGKGYTHQKTEISRDIIRRHLDNAQPIAVFPVEGETTHISEK